MSEVESPNLSLIDQAELDIAIRAHEIWAKNQAQGRRAVFREKQLAQLSFAGRTMRDADFTGAILSGCIFRKANFERAILYCANLSRVDGRFANLKGTDLRGASMFGANMAGAMLDGADFRAARLARVDRFGNFEIVKFSEGKAGTGAQEDTTGTVNFSNCSLKGASFKGAYLQGANFSGALLNNANFAGARLNGANMNGAVLSGVNVADLRLPRQALENCILDSTEAQLARGPILRAAIEAHAIWVETQAKDGQAGIFDGEDLRVVAPVFMGRKLPAMSARNVIAAGIDFSRSQLQGVNFDGADLREANFEGCDLRGASFRGANLSWSKFGRARLEAMPLVSGATLSTAFEGAKLFGADFSSAVVGNADQA